MAYSIDAGLVYFFARSWVPGRHDVVLCRVTLVCLGVPDGVVLYRVTFACICVRNDSVDSFGRRGTDMNAMRAWLGKSERHVLYV